VIGPYEVKQQFNACATFDESSNFMRLRKALHALLLAKLGPAKAASSFTGACVRTLSPREARLASRVSVHRPNSGQNIRLTQPSLSRTQCPP
jgi:hypothetical protein